MCSKCKWSMEKGSIVLYVLLVGALVFLLLFSSFSIGFIDFLSVQSNEEGLKAYYLAETGMEMILDEMIVLSDKIIGEFLKDLHQYKEEYIGRINNGEKLVYTPPQLSTYIQYGMIANLQKFNRIENSIFSEYDKNHSFDSKVYYIHGKIQITITGSYNDASKILLARVELPQVLGQWNDFNSVIKVTPLDIVSMHQISE